MFNNKWKTFVVLAIVIVLASLLSNSCTTTSSEDEKIANANNQELLILLEKGSVSERRKVSAILRNNVKKENLQALSIAVTSDTDEIVVSNCAKALGKIGDSEAIRILSETILSFTDFRSEICAISLVSYHITSDIINKVEKIIAKKPELLNKFIKNMKLSNNSYVLDFQNKILQEYEKYPVQVVSQLIERAGNTTDKKSLPILYQIYYNAKNAELKIKAERAIDCFSEELKNKVGEHYDEILIENAEIRAEELRMKEIQKRRRLEKLTPPIPYEQMKENTMYPSAVYVEKLELVKDYATIGHPGGFNGKENEGELLTYNVHIKNNSDLNFNQLSGYCYAYTKSATVLNRRIFFNKVTPGSLIVSQNHLLVLISPNTKAGEKIELFFEFGESKSGDHNIVIYSKIEIEIKPLDYGPFEFVVSDFDDDQWGMSEGNNNGLLEWGETCEIQVNIQNLGKNEVELAQLEIIASNQLCRIGDSLITLDKIKPDQQQGAVGIFNVTLSSEYDGDYDMNLIIKLNVIKNKKIAGTWTQKLQISIGKKTPKLIDGVVSYKNFDVDKLIDIFVVKQNNEDLQELFLFNTEVDFMDAKSLLILEKE